MLWRSNLGLPDWFDDRDDRGAALIRLLLGGLVSHIDLTGPETGMRQLSRSTHAFAQASVGQG